MALHIVCRSYGGENQKGRPDYYSKLLSLLSLLRAAEEAKVEPVFINDGPIPASRFRLMESSGEVVERQGLGMRGSYMAALHQATSGGWDDDDTVWMGEDDYLYRPEAFTQLAQAAEQIREAEYFALYGSPPSRPVKPDDVPEFHRPAGWRDLPPWYVDERAWVRIYSTTSSFGGRVGALRQDLGIMRFCMVPHLNAIRDHDTLLLLQGFEPYSYRELAREAVGLSPGWARNRMRAVALVPFRLASNLRSHRRPSRRRLLLAPQPNLATHMELGWIAPDTDWRAVAEDTRDWALGRGLVVKSELSF